jgi:histone acetyltransferase (RNA polymerase elongator complex component)
MQVFRDGGRIKQMDFSIFTVQSGTMQVRNRNGLSASPAHRELRHYTIPVFIPGLACPFQCIYCDQKKITGRPAYMEEEEIRQIIEDRLATIPNENTEKEIGYFGGTFTGLPLEKQRHFLEIASRYVYDGAITGIRISTRPDCIDPEILDLLSQYPVRTIELGVQSMDDEVLRLSNRGHTSLDSRRAARMIRDAGFSLGLQMMIGLPGDTLEKSLYTARKIVEMEAETTRIYPVLVIRGTPLEKLYRSGEYHAMEIPEAVTWTKQVMNIFENSSIRVIRIGIHPSDGLESRADLVAGPYHASFRELVMTEIWKDRFHALLHNQHGKQLVISINPADLNNAIGYFGNNKKLLLERFREVKFRPSASIPEKTFHADIR